jgi:hypothetical protein
MKRVILVSFLLFSILFFTGVRAKEFYPVKYNFWSSSISATVGKSVDMPIYVQNLGLLPDSYTVNVTLSQSINPNVIKIENDVSHTEQLPPLQIGKTSATLKLQSATAGSITLKIFVTSDSYATYNKNNPCSSPSDCSDPNDPGRDIYECLSGKCVRSTEIIVKTGMASLPEFDWLGLLQIILLASILAFVKF